LDRIYYCPHHPEVGYPGENPTYKIECECRKPKVGLFEMAFRDLPADPASSWMVGDSWRDIESARNLKIPALGVRTGGGCQGTSPDLLFDDVFDAVQFVVHGLPMVSQFVDVIEDKMTHQNPPLIVGTCGVARSGKTCFSYALSTLLKKKKMSVLIVHLDDWILPRSQRNGTGPEDRAQVSLYPQLLKRLLAGQEVTTNRYDPLTREWGGQVTYRWQNEQIIILEGTLACHPSIQSQLHGSFYLEAAASVLDQRFRNFYLWKGDEPSRIEQLQQDRTEEESPVVRAQMRFAEHIIQSDLFVSGTSDAPVKFNR
jgi:mannose-1-phosphate guanylyltransferase / phosphomannomutase